MLRLLMSSICLQNCYKTMLDSIIISVDGTLICNRVLQEPVLHRLLHPILTPLSRPTTPNTAPLTAPNTTPNTVLNTYTA